MQNAADKLEIKWIETEVRLRDLVEYHNNPRKITKEAFDKLVDLIKRNGYHQRIMVDQNNVIIGGHQRRKVFKALGYRDDSLIKVLKPHRDITQAEFDELNVSDNGFFGDFHMDGLANMGYSVKTLISWGVPSSSFADMFGSDPTPKAKEKPPIICPNCSHEIVNN
jgi:hypothetical protein